MGVRKLFHSGLVTAAVLACVALAAAREGALAFIRHEHQTLTKLLRQPPSPSRDAKVDNTLANLVDYDELTRRSFGQPCPRARPNCTNYWATFTPAQRAEVTPLLKQLVMKTERRNVLKTLDYEVEYKGERRSETESTVRMEARSKLKPRDPVVLVDYIAVEKGGNWRVVDIVTEGSSRTKNYYEQFSGMLAHPKQGYPYVLATLKENIVKKDAEAKANGNGNGNE